MVYQVAGFGLNNGWTDGGTTQPSLLYSWHTIFFVLQEFSSYAHIHTVGHGVCLHLCRFFSRSIFASHTSRMELQEREASELLYARLTVACVPGHYSQGSCAFLCLQGVLSDYDMNHLTLR